MRRPILALLLLVCLPSHSAMAQDRVTVAVTSRAVADLTLTVVTASGATLVINAADLVYVRDDWPHWIDDDGDCQDTRQEVLIAESITPVTLDPAGCRVIGGAWRDLYTGATHVDPGELDVDHFVPLANAFRTGGWSWNYAQRRAYANDLADGAHLIAVSASANRSKGDRGPDQWRPDDRSAWCTYAQNWTLIKQRWGLAATQAEQDALLEMSVGCGTSAPAPTPPPPSPTPSPSPTPTPTPAPPSASCVNINTAPASELERIIHIGPERAAEMILLRPFRSVDDLVRVTGIGPARLADIKAQGLACV